VRYLSRSTKIHKARSGSQRTIPDRAIFISGPPPRPSRPEAAGLRHLAFEVDNIDEAIFHLNEYDVVTEPIRIDEFTGKRFTFFTDPDGLPLELYEK
jgi:catechol 2,3-dioxygenase-like lactoylglutathione lyase family enzyme